MELSELGAGYVMFFKLVIFFGGILIVFSVINIIKAIANFGGSWCISESEYKAMSTSSSIGSLPKTINYVLLDLPVCNEDWVTVHSIANYGVFIVDEAEKSWMMIALLAYWFVLAICKHYIDATNKEIDRKSDLPSDWTLMVRGLPPDESIADIKNNFEMYGTLGKMPCPVKKISMAYRCSEYEELAKKVDLKKRQMKKQQLLEMAAAIKVKEEKDSKAQKDEVKSKVGKPDIKDFSADFQKKFEALSEQTREVNRINLSSTK